MSIQGTKKKIVWKNSEYFNILGVLATQANYILLDKYKLVFTSNKLDLNTYCKTVELTNDHLEELRLIYDKIPNKKGIVRIVLDKILMCIEKLKADVEWENKYKLIDDKYKKIKVEED